jgi:hypothetical protein
MSARLNQLLRSPGGSIFDPFFAKRCKSCQPTTLSDFINYTYICPFIPLLSPMSSHMLEPHSIPLPTQMQQRQHVYYEIIVPDWFPSDGAEFSDEPSGEVVHAYVGDWSV